MASGMPDLEKRFAALKPHMAHYFPFELDTFQKEAILHLEQVRVMLGVLECSDPVLHGDIFNCKPDRNIHTVGTLQAHHYWSRGVSHNASYGRDPPPRVC